MGYNPSLLRLFAIRASASTTRSGAIASAGAILLTAIATAYCCFHFVFFR